jgi:cyclophilin family peptidyl-prolyl cis-trans isomerase/HEAT repeat protein
MSRIRSRVLFSAGVFLVASIAHPGAQNPRAPIATCGVDADVATPEPLTRVTIALAADRRLFSPCPAGQHGASHQEARDLELLDRAAAASDGTFRQMAAQAFGQFASPEVVARLIKLLSDSWAPARAEAALGIAKAMSGTRSDLRQDAAPTAAQLLFARDALEAQLAKETNPDVPLAAMAILEAIGRLRLEGPDLDRAEALLVENVSGGLYRLHGAVKGLTAAAIRRRALSADARARLRAASGLGRENATSEVMLNIRRLAMTALQAARDNDTTTVLEAAKDPDWQVRRIAVQMMTPTIDVYGPAILAAFKDPSMNVRLEAISSQAKDRSAPRACGPIVAAVADPVPLVSLQAIGALVPECALAPDVIAMLATIADELMDPQKAATWHRGSRALTTLARIAPEEARKRLPSAAKHGVWQVRAASAGVAATLAAEAVVVTLASDSHPNVRTDAIEALVRIKSPATAAAALPALNSPDFQLVQAAARALAAEKSAVPQLLAALTRLTGEGADTSRDPRVAIITTLTGLLGAEGVGQLAPWTADWDTAVRAAAGRAYTTAKVAVPDLPTQYRYPLQPTAQELTDHLSAKVLEIEMESGTVVMELLPWEAPLAVSRIVALARRGYYTGLTFHRIVPNFVVQGGSPGANEYVGDARFMRDAVGLHASHARGAVGISTRGYDTGDAQIFFDLVDVPRLDQDYTVFARVTAGMQVVDGMLEGATIRRVTVK